MTSKIFYCNLKFKLVAPCPKCGIEQEHNKSSPTCIFIHDLNMFGMRNGLPPALRKSPRQNVMVVPGVPYDWYPVDGGEGRACRGATSGDNNPSYYSVVSGAAGIEMYDGNCPLAT